MASWKANVFHHVEIFILLDSAVNAIGTNPKCFFFALPNWPHVIIEFPDHVMPS